MLLVERSTRPSARAQLDRREECQPAGRLASPTSRSVTLMSTDRRTVPPALSTVTVYRPARVVQHQRRDATRSPIDGGGRGRVRRNASDRAPVAYPFPPSAVTARGSPVSRSRQRCAPEASQTTPPAGQASRRRHRGHQQERRHNRRRHQVLKAVAARRGMVNSEPPPSPDRRATEATAAALSATECQPTASSRNGVGPVARRSRICSANARPPRCSGQVMSPFGLNPETNGSGKRRSRQSRTPATEWRAPGSPALDRSRRAAICSSASNRRPKTRDRECAG